MTNIWNHLQGVEFKQSYYDAGGVRTRAIEAGDGPPLILLHGTGGHAEAYVKISRPMHSISTSTPSTWWATATPMPRISLMTCSVTWTL